MKRVFPILMIPAVIVGCKKPVEEEFDRGAMLDNMASAVIISSLETVNTDLADLQTVTTSFTANPEAGTLSALRSEFLQTYEDFQHCKIYNFGPMMDFGVKASMNTYPTDSSKIESNITSGSYSLGGAGNIDAEGLPAMDYLLYFPNDAGVVANFTTEPSAANRIAYLEEIVAKMKLEFQYVLDGWDTYKTEFVAADGTDVGSSAGLLFNEFVKDLELLKNAKIGIPGGQFSAGEALPEMTEAHFSKHSKTLALESAIALKTCFQGATGIGYDDYIQDVEGEEVTTSLATNIINQFNLVHAKISDLGPDFNSDVTTNFDGFQETFQEIKKIVTYTKTDMASLLGLQITFSDSDGD